jgi:choline dehydrogenase-like flavoprotein
MRRKTPASNLGIKTNTKTFTPSMDQSSQHSKNLLLTLLPLISSSISSLDISVVSSGVRLRSLPCQFYNIDPCFIEGVPQEFAENHNALTAITLLAHPSSKGSVRLTGPHPQDLLNIQKLHFQDPVNGQKDVTILREGIKRARNFVSGSLVNLVVDHELLPGEQAKTDADIENYIYDSIFGMCLCHHTTSMGDD